MRVSVMIDPEGTVGYGTVVALARHIEELGFDGLYLSDHYDAVFGWHGPGAPETWVLLAGLMRDTKRIALGTLVTPVTLRRFGTLVKTVATVGLMDHPDSATSPNPRLHLGLGAGWLAPEHHGIGAPFPSARERFDMLEEHLRAWHALWDAGTEPLSFDGQHVTLAEFRLTPRPTMRPRIILGGRGRVRMPRLAATYADELNVPFVPLEELRVLRTLLHDACKAVGREPASITFSAKRGILVGATRCELEHRARSMQELAGDDRATAAYIDWLRTRWIVGTPAEAAEQVSGLRESGVEHLILQHLLPHDLSMLTTTSEEVLALDADSTLSAASSDDVAGKTT